MSGLRGRSRFANQENHAPISFVCFAVKSKKFQV
jgi:hypothetical protein